MRKVAESLPDALYALSATAVAELVASLHDELGRKPSLEEITELLTWGLRTNRSHIEGTPIFSSIVLSSRAKASRQELKVGDLVLVPAADGSHSSAMLHLGRFGRFGDAYGLFHGKHTIHEVSPGWAPARVRRFPLFVHDEFVANGRWPIVGNRPDLVALFFEPRMLYRPGTSADGVVSKYGRAESLTTGVVQLSQEEGEEAFAGLPANGKGVFLCPELESFLERLP